MRSNDSSLLANNQTQIHTQNKKASVVQHTNLLSINMALNEQKCKTKNFYLNFHIKTLGAHTHTHTEEKPAHPCFRI